MHRDFRVIDADGHVLEPPDLWEKYIDPEFRSQAPRCFGAMSVEVMGHRMPDVPGWKEVREKTGWPAEKRFAFAAERGFDAVSQVQAMDMEGIDMAVLYPSRGLFAASADGIPGPLAGAICRAYNRWLAEFCSHDPRRLFGAALVSLHDPEVAAREAVYAVEELGMKSVFIRPNPVDGRTIDHVDFDEFYAEVERMGVPVATHEGAGVHLAQYGRERYDKLFKVHMVCHAVESMTACMDLIVGGVLERHPRLRCVFLEASSGWAPWWLERMDEHFHGFHGKREASYLTMNPSEYFKRQCFVSAEVDERAAQYVVDAFGEGNLVVGSDYPHGDGSFPHAIEAFIGVETLSEDAKRKALWDNPLRLYGLEKESAALGVRVPAAGG
ncbi:MAG: amidohydrolase family protein [Myxococcota bacterium]